MHSSYSNFCLLYEEVQHLCDIHCDHFIMNRCMPTIVSCDGWAGITVYSYTARRQERILPILISQLTITLNSMRIIAKALLGKSDGLSSPPQCTCMDASLNSIQMANTLWVSWYLHGHTAQLLGSTRPHHSCWLLHKRQKLPGKTGTPGPALLHPTGSMDSGTWEWKNVGLLHFHIMALSPCQPSNCDSIYPWFWYTPALVASSLW